MKISLIHIPLSRSRWKLPKPKLITASIILLSMGCAGASWWFRQHSTTAAETRPAAVQPLTVQTIVVQRHSVAAERMLTGTVEAINSTTLMSRINGRVEQLPVQEGMQVEKGQVLAVIDVSDVQAKQQQATAQITQAQAAVATAQANRSSALSQVDTARGKLSEAQASLLEAKAELADAQLNQHRRSMLYYEGAGPKVDLDTANTRVNVAQAKIRQIEATIAQAASSIKNAEATVGEATASVEQAQAQIPQAEAAVREVSANLDYGVVRAPFAGVITKKQVDVGAMAGAGQPLMTLESGNRLRLSVAVPESLINRVQLGQSVRVHIDALNRQVSGNVSQIIPAADPQSRNFTVKVALTPTAHLISGMFGRLQLDTDDRTALVIPKDTLVERLGVSGAFKVVDGKAQFQTVTVQPINGNEVEVFAGIKEGDRLILNPTPGLQDNTEISDSTQSAT
jgi:multidrug efflux pump subunit AcrA (membrane-fusion protein)